MKNTESGIEELIAHNEELKRLSIHAFIDHLKSIDCSGDKYMGDHIRATIKRAEAWGGRND